MASIRELQDYIKRQKKVIRELNDKLRQKELLLEFQRHEPKAVLKPVPDHSLRYFMVGLVCGALLMVLILTVIL
jgi:hypothetical protein